MTSDDAWYTRTTVLALLVIAFLSAVVAFTAAPPMVLLFGVLALFVPLMQAAKHKTKQDTDEANREPDPVTVLQDRYARGEISEEEFEQRLATILDSDERVNHDRSDEQPNRDLITEQN